MSLIKYYKNNLEFIPIILAVVYCPQSIDFLLQYLNTFFLTLGYNFILRGDLNVKLINCGCHSNTPKGTALNQALVHKNYSIVASPNLIYRFTYNKKISML